MTRILQRQELVAQERESDLGKPKFVLDEKTPSDPLSVLWRFMYSSDEQETKKIIQDCYEFIKHFRITHYIELGAAEYRVFSETDFNSTIGADGVLAVEKIASLSASHKRISRIFKKASDVKAIGKISKEGTVGRGTHEEAVVGIRVQPLSTLVKFPFLKLAL